jgi:hypothetical protein
MARVAARTCGVKAAFFTELRTTATGLKAGVGWTFMKRFARLWRMGFGSWCSRMVRTGADAARLIDLKHILNPFVVVAN